MRKTYFDGEWTPNIQSYLDTVWDLIEDNDGLNWRVERNGDLTLEVDDATLELILTHNPLTAMESFGPSRPEYLQGTYTIKGVYDASQRLINGTRVYFFTQEGY